MSEWASRAIAGLVAALMLLAGVALAGAGHGWVPGGYGCLALAPVAYFAWANALGPRPSRRSAITHLTLGLVVCTVVGVATTGDGFQYFVGFWRISGLAGILVGSLAYFNWLFVSLLAMVRARRVVRVGP